MTHTGKNPKKNGYVYNWFTLLNSRNEHSTVSQLYSNKNHFFFLKELYNCILPFGSTSTAHGVAKNWTWLSNWTTTVIAIYQESPSGTLADPLSVFIFLASSPSSPFSSWGLGQTRACICGGRGNLQEKTFPHFDLIFNYIPTVFWTRWEKVRVGWYERIALKHVYYRMWSRSPVQVWCMRQGAQGWCTGMTLRDGMGREVGGGFRMGNACTPRADSCQCMAKPTTIL